MLLSSSYVYGLEDSIKIKGVPGLLMGYFVSNVPLLTCWLINEVVVGLLL